ncbi:MAG: D-alanine--D-alanine ligase [Spirochaetaceae bacterium]|nr:D-alanine--D-alanine ligase [Spirochaetaceae bacterium]
MNVTLIYGGKTGEHEISLVSASSVARNIKAKHKITLIGIAKNGTWFLQPETELERIRKDKDAVFSLVESENIVSVIPGGSTKQGLLNIASKKFLPTDIVFPVLHGTFGEDGTIQGLLEMAELPYVGCGVMASSLTMDKEKTKEVWKMHKLPVVPYVTAKKYELNNDAKIAKFIEKVEKKFGYPVFIKPCCAGSSVGANKASTKEEFVKALSEAFLWDEKILIEQFIPAREIECSVIGNAKIKTFSPGELEATHDFYDYDAKYNDPNGATLRIPANLTEQQAKTIQKMAKKAYAALDAAGFSRIDFFLDKNTGKIYLNEINTIPGFTSISMFPKMCENGGLLYPELLEKVLKMGIERFTERRKLQTTR